MACPSGTDELVPSRDRRVSCPGWIDDPCPSGIDKARARGSKASKASDASQHPQPKQAQSPVKSAPKSSITASASRGKQSKALANALASQASAFGRKQGQANSRRTRLASLSLEKPPQEATAKSRIASCPQHALPQPIQSSSGYGWPVRQTDFKFWPVRGLGLTRAVSRRGTDLASKP